MTDLFYPNHICKESLEDVIEHHGILGQKWGKKQGPPYPLDAGDHSQREVKEGYKKSLGGGRNEELYDRKSKKSDTKTKKKEKITKEDIANHRKEMIAYYKKQGDKDAVKLYEEVSDETIKQDLQHKKNIKKALIIAGTTVGIAAGVYLIYKYRLNKTLDIASKGAGKNIDQLVKQGLSIDTASKVMSFEAGGDFLKDKKSVKKIMEGLSNEMDLVIKNPSFGKITFGEHLKDIHNIEYMSFSKGDIKSYKLFLRDWAAEAQGIKHRKALLTKIESMSGEFKIPSTKKQAEIINELFKTNPTIKNEVQKSLENILEKAYRIAGYKDPSHWAKISAEAEMQAYGKVQATVHALIDHNPVLDKTISEAFRNKGYNGIIDLFDSKIGRGSFTDLPIIAFKEGLHII